jgi:hypothetical protein
MFRSLLLSLIFISSIRAQGGPAGHLITGPALPALCSPLSGDVWVLTTGTPTGVMYSCTAANTWSVVSTAIPPVAAATGIAAPTFATTALATAVAQPVDGWQVQTGSGLSFASLPGVSVANPVTCGAGAVTWNTGLSIGPVGKQLTSGAFFNASGDCPSTNTTNFNPSITTAFSVSYWATFHSLGTLDLTVTQLDASAHGWYLSVSAAACNCLQFFLQDTTGGIASIQGNASTPLTADVLYHVAVTYDGSKNTSGMKMWINGRAINVTSITNTLAGTWNLSSNPIYIGSYPAGTFRHSGYISGVRVYTGQLTFPQIAALYNAGPMVDNIQVATRTSQTVYASSFATLDLDLTNRTKIGGGTPTNNDAKINAVLASATCTNPLDFVLDGATATSGFTFMPTGCTTFRGIGWGSGFYVQPGSNHEGITNGFGLFPIGTPPTQGKNVIVANMKADCDRGTYPNGNANAGGDARGGTNSITCIELHNIIHGILDHVWIYDPPSYHFLSANWTDLIFTSNRFEVPTPSNEVNTDGIHLDGPGSYATMSNNWFSTGDDSMALNAPEGYTGNISNVFISNSIEAGSAQSLRMYTYTSTAAFTISNVIVNGLTGTTINNFFNIGAGQTNAGRVADAITSVKFTNCLLTSSVGASFGWYISEAIGDLTVSNCTWVSPIGSNALMSFNPAGTAASISNLRFDDVHVYRNATGNASPPLISLNNNATVTTLAVNNFEIDDLTGSAYTAVASVVDVPSGGSVGLLKVPFWNPTHLTAFLSAGSSARVTNINTTVNLPGATPSVSTGSCAGATIGANAGNISGTITGLPTGVCTTVLTFTSQTAPNGWTCPVQNQTHPGSTNIFGQSAQGTGSVTFTGTSVTGDVLAYGPCSMR